MIDPSKGVWRFRIGPWPVAVHWFFWLTMFLISLSYRELWVMLTFVALAFVAVLTHEIGHQLMFRRFDADGHILLYGFGGLAFGREVPFKKQWLVSLGGPGMNLLTGLPVWWYLNRMGGYASLGAYGGTIAGIWVFVTIWWGIFNLLPILPLDGGNIVHNLSSQWKGRDTLRGTRICSVVTAVAFGCYVLWLDNAMFRAGLGGFRLGMGFVFMMILAATNLAALKGHDLVNEGAWQYVSAGDHTPAGREAGVDRFAGRTPARANVVSLEDARKKKAKAGPDDEIALALSALERHDGARALDAIASARRQKLKADQASLLDELEGWAYLAERKPVLAADVAARLPKKSVAQPFLAAGVALVGGERDAGIEGLAVGILEGVEGHSKTLAVELVASEGVTAEVAKALLDRGGKGFESALRFQVALKKLGRTAHAAMVDDVILSGGA